MGRVERDQKGIIKHLRAGSRRASCIHLHLKGWGRGGGKKGLREPSKRCGYRRFQWMSAPRVKLPPSQGEGRRRAREINVLNPTPTPWSPASASFVQSHVKAGGHWSQLIRSTKVSLLAHSTVENGE